MPFLTDDGNYILDCRFHQNTARTTIAKRTGHIVGVVEYGLFLGRAEELIVGTRDTPQIIERANKTKPWSD